MSWLALLPSEGTLVAALVVLMMLDVLTGWGAAYITGTISSAASWRGVTRKLMTLAVVLVVGLVNLVAPSPLASFPLLLPALIGYIGGEVYSILENVKRAGVPLPAPLDRAFVAREDLPHDPRSARTSGDLSSLADRHRSG